MISDRDSITEKQKNIRGFADSVHKEGGRRDLLLMPNNLKIEQGGGKMEQEQKVLSDMEEKKEYLRGYEKAVRQMKRSELKIQEMRLNIMFPSAANDGMPHALSQNDLSGYMALLDKEEKRYMKYRYERIKKCKEITSRIEQMTDEDEKDILMYRYIKLLKWEDIAVKIAFSRQYMFKIHLRALKNFKMR